MEYDIKSIGRRMTRQDNRSTQYPLFMVQKKVKIYDANGDESERAYEIDPAYLCDECKKLDQSGEDLPDQCDDCRRDAFVYFRCEWEFDLSNGAGVFFTAEACDRHIEANRHHYGSTARSFAVSAWRNPELQKVMRHLIETADEQIPNYYQ